MSRDNKTNLAATHKPAAKLQPSKRNLLVNFIKFMAWVIVIGLILSPLACTLQISDDTNKLQGGDYE